MRRIFACLAAVLLLGACQQTLQADVTRFSTGPALTGRSVAILPEPGQAGSLEFQHYAQLLAAVLPAHGLRPLPPAGPPADLVAFLHYGPAGSRTEYYTEPAPAWGAMGWSPHYGWGGWGGGYAEELHSTTTYSQQLEVAIYDGPAWRAGNHQMVWQGRALGNSGIHDLNSAMPYLVQALFQDFPGVSGQTVRLALPVGG